MGSWLLFVVLFQGLTAQEHSFGIGVMLGEPLGVSMKLWLSGTEAIDGGFGVSGAGDRVGLDAANGGTNERSHLHLDYLWHAFGLFTEEERYPVYTGLGVRINSGGALVPSLAARALFGVAWMPRTVPIDMFMELVPMIQFYPDAAYGLEASVGIRYYL